MIINLIGPPTAGKSTFASRFILEHPFFTYCAIDAYRAENSSEAQAWHCLLKDIIGHRNVVLESCGLDWRLELILNNETIRRRPIMTIAFMGEKDLLLKRLRDRQRKRKPVFQYNFSDEINTLDWVMEQLALVPAEQIDLHIQTTGVTPERVYNSLIPDIMEFRLRHDVKKQGRRSKPYRVSDHERNENANHIS